MGERPSEFTRDPHDWYVEPEWCVRALLDNVEFEGKIHDPCCGQGTIPDAIGPRLGTGADIVDRSNGRFPVQDFLADTSRYDNIVTNPPYGIAEKIAWHALSLAYERVALLVQLKFLASQRRHELLRCYCERVLIFSRRPSMPPGIMLREHGESIRGGGSIDFCWVVLRYKPLPDEQTIRWVIPRLEREHMVPA